MTANHNTKNWNIADIKLAITFLRSMTQAGLPIAEALTEIAKLQPTHADFWLAGATHTQNGKPLYLYLADHWPETIVTPISIAEISGKLNSVLLGIEKTLTQQREIRKMMKGFIYPAFMTVAGIAVFLGFLVYVIPGMFSAMKMPKEAEMVNNVLAAASFMQDNMPYIAMTIVALGALSIHQWKTNPEARHMIFATIDKLPGIGRSTRWLYFSTWSSYVAIMHDAGITWGPILEKTLSVLPPHLQPAIRLIAQNIEQGQSVTQASHVTGTNVDNDSRNCLPIHVKNAFRMTDISGNGCEQFALASDTLYEPARETLATSIETTKNGAMIFAALIAFSPMGLYFAAIGTMMQNR